jgi:hypothetical protein
VRTVQLRFPHFQPHTLTPFPPSEPG